ncbi:MAG: hypothetical protein Q4P84_08265 [Elusimicrobiales bacterium]|nr:hypothetical protein [Elusimicrobiales bacterium]
MIQKLIWLASAVGIACVYSLILTPIARGVMRRIGAVDMPDPRRVNRVPVPRGGGTGVVAAFLLSLLTLHWLWPEALSNTPVYPIIWWYLGSMLLVVIVGFIDDRWGLSPIVKLGGQILAAVIIAWGGGDVIHLHLPDAWGAWVNSPWIYFPVTVFWYLGVMNAFNLIDGLDGLSSGLAIISTCGLAGVAMLGDHGMVPIFSAAFVGVLLGFLHYNNNPASVFLGDTGSLFLGFTLATLALVAQRPNAFLATIGVAVLCMGVPLMDTCLAILRRTLRYVLKRSEHEETDQSAAELAMTADKDHMHHRLLAAAGGNQKRAVWGLYALAIALVVVGFGSLALTETKATAFLIGFLACAYVVIRMMTNVELWDAGKLLARSENRAGKRGLSAAYYLFCDVFFMVASFVVIAYMMRDMLPPLPRSTWIHLCIAYCVPVIIALVLFNAYTRVWGRATRKDSFGLIIAIFLGSLVSHFICARAVPSLNEDTTDFHMIWSAIQIIPMLTVRYWRPAFLQFIASAENHLLIRKSQNDPSIERILFYGAGVNLRAYITFFEHNVTRNNVALVGVLDDNVGLRGRIYRDVPILGSLEDLEANPKLFAKVRPTKIIVTTPVILEPRFNQIREFCQKHGLKLSRYDIHESHILS